MSYPSLPGYSGYYDANQQRPSACSSNRQSQRDQHAPVTLPADRQTQYATSAYDWQGQGQQAYNQNAEGSHNDEQYRRGRQGQYDYRRDASNYTTHSVASNPNHNSATTAGRSQNLQGLKNLAYASGLDPQTSASPQQSTATKAHYNKGSVAPGNRVQPPLYALSHQRQYSTTPRNTYTPASPSNGTPLQVAAAQPLAGASNRKNQRENTQPQAQGQQPPASSYGASTQHRRTPSQSQLASSPNVSKQRAPPGPQNPGMQRNATSSASQATSITNLVTPHSESGPVLAATSQDSMPTYIDPSQVFNPYHREHEQRRKEAAEAEAAEAEMGRKQEEAKQSEEEARQKQEEAQRKAEEEAAAKVASKATGAAAEAAKWQERQQKRKDASKDRTKAAGKGPANTPTSAPEEDMAIQMKMMMDKMKEFRQKDPTNFQKLWDDMRKGGPNVVAGSSNKAPSTSPKIVQAAAPRPIPPPAPKQPSVPPQTEPTIPAVQAVQAVTQAIQQTAQAFQPAQVLTAPKTARKEPVHPVGFGPHVPLNGHKVVVEDNADGLPDLGRFPAERRVRQSYEKRSVPVAPGLQRLALQGPAPTQPLPGRNSSAGVEWPRDKRQALAKAAIEALKGEQANADLEITPADVNAMLDQIPSYMELCTMLEQKRFKFHRGQFARQLLTSVPDLSKAQNQQSPAQFHPPLPPRMPPQAPQMMHPTASMMPTPGPIAQPFRGPNYGHNGVAMVAPPPYHGPYGQAGVNGEERMQKRKSLPPSRPEPPPGSKAASARKRDFSELVDLTQLSDNDDYVLSSKRPRLDSTSPEPTGLLRQFQVPNGIPPPPPASFVLGSQTSMHLPSQPVSAPPEPPQNKGPILARPVNMSEALTKEYYDPKTVARDVMIAAGRHPTERPLNAHLAGMLNKHIELDSDLSTFDWDAIDPGGPPMPKVAYVDVPAAPPRYRLGERPNKPLKHTKKDKDKDKDKDGSREGGAKAAGDAIPDLDKRAAPAAATETESATAGATTSPAPFARLDVRSKQRSDAKEQSEPGPSRLRESLRASSVVSVTSSKHKASTSLELASRIVSPAPSSQMSTPNNVFPSGKRRGRPPGSKNKHVSLPAMRQQFRTPVVEIPDESSHQNHPVFKCRFPRCGNELHNLETLRKHIRKKHAPGAEELQSALPYKCWWKKCPARNEDQTFSATREFSTVDALMDHLNETHLHELAMKFGDGPKTSPVDRSTTTTTNAHPTYLTNALGQQTTPAISLNPTANDALPTDTWIITSTVSRKPTTNTTTLPAAAAAAASSTTMTDHVTEPTRLAADNDNDTEAAANHQALRAFLRVHKTKGFEGPRLGVKAQAEQMLRAMERRKRDLGVGLDRGGCTLVNEARREGFVHAPGVRRVVEAE